MLIMMDGAVTHTKTLQRARGTVDVGFATDALARLYQAAVDSQRMMNQKAAQARADEAARYGRTPMKKKG